MTSDFALEVAKYPQNLQITQNGISKTMRDAREISSLLQESGVAEQEYEVRLCTRTNEIPQK